MTSRSHPDYYALVKEALPGADFVGEENWYRAPAPKYCLPGDQCGDAHLTGGSGFVQIGDWRIGDVDNGDHFAISLVYPGGSAAVFTSTGLAHKGSERTSLPGTPPPFYAQAYSLGARKIMAQPQGIRVGDGFIEFNKKWRLWLTPDSRYLALVHRSGTVAGTWSDNTFVAGTGAPKQFAHIDGQAAWSAGFNNYGSEDATSCTGWDCSINGQFCPNGAPGSGKTNYLCTSLKWVATASRPEDRKVTMGKNGGGFQKQAAAPYTETLFGPSRENDKYTITLNGEYLSIGPMRISATATTHRSLLVTSKRTGSTSIGFWSNDRRVGWSKLSKIFWRSEITRWSEAVLTTQTEHVLPLGYGRFRGCTLSPVGDNVKPGANLIS